MESFLKIWDGAESGGQIAIGLAVFIVLMTLLIGGFSAFDSTVGKWAAHRWPGPPRQDDDDEDDDD